MSRLYLPQLVFPLSPLLSSSELVSKDPHTPAAQPTPSPSIHSTPAVSVHDTPITSNHKHLQSQDVFAILESLEQAEQDVICEVERVKEAIKDARRCLEKLRKKRKIKNKENIAWMYAERKKSGKETFG